MSAECARARRRHHAGGTLTSLLMGTVVLSLGAFGWWWFGQTDAAPGVDEDRVVAVEQRSLVDAVNATGRVEPLARVAVMSRASGMLKELLVDAGDVVAAGQVLAELDREQLTAQLAQDQADLASAQARLAASRARVDEAQVRLTDPELAFAEREQVRLEQLFHTGDVTQKERDDAAQVLEAVRFRIQQVNGNIAVLRASVQEAEANLLAAGAALDRSQTALREATILSPIAGVILTRDKEVGDGVSSLLTAGGNATQIFTLGDLSAMYVEARVDEVDLGRIRVGMEALVSVDAHRGKTLLGQVARIAPAGSVDNNGIVTFEVRVTVEDPESLLRPDMTADARLVLRKQDDALCLPQRAVQRNGRDTFVQRVIGTGLGAVVEHCPVTLGLSDGLMTQVLDGLSAGDRVLLPVAGSSGGPPRRGP